MKRFRLLFSVVFLLMLFGVSAVAQNTAPQSSSTKIAVIYTDAFADPKSGIAKFVTQIAALRKEFDPLNIELKAMGERYENLRKEIEGLQTQASNPNGIVSQASIQPKVDEYGRLGRELQFKQEDIKAKYESRFNILVRPVLADISKAIQDYAKQKGYAVIFDAAKLEDSGLIIGIGDEKVDVTKEFIAYYNARPSSAATDKP